MHLAVFSFLEHSRKDVCNSCLVGVMLGSYSMYSCMLDFVSCFVSQGLSDRPGIQLVVTYVTMDEEAQKDASRRSRSY